MKKTHGTRYIYNAGCRCEDCRQANNSYMSQYRRNRIKNTPLASWRNKRLWEPWEDILAGDYTKSAWQVAQILERTPAAVTNRRKLLLARHTGQ